jgi:hypothetical protein
MAKAPLYYKQAIEHAESEWSQHHAKRLIDTKTKGLRGSVPPGFPYFYVQARALRVPHGPAESARLLQAHADWIARLWGQKCAG